MDVHSIRAFPADRPPGMIGLEDGVQAFESLRNLILAAAYSVSTEQPKAFELDLFLAASRPLLHRELKPIRFRHDHLPVLEAAAQELRERVAEEAVAVIGNVVRLHREGLGSGEISVAGTVEGEDRLRRIWMDLPAEDYVQATRAHEQMLNVSVRGDLVRRGTRLFLRIPSGFQVIPDSSDD